MGQILVVDFGRSGALDIEQQVALRLALRDAAIGLVRHAGQAARVRVGRPVPRVGSAMVWYPPVPGGFGLRVVVSVPGRDPVFEVEAAAEWLRDPLSATEGRFFEEYAWVTRPDAVQALQWIREKCRSRPAARVSAEEAGLWDARRVRYLGPAGQVERVLTVREAVLVYGPMYGRALDVVGDLDKLAGVLRAAHGLEAEDARLVAQAVQKCRFVGGGRS